MPSAAYRLFRTAILGRRRIVCEYDGCYREVCPHVLGYKERDAMALTFQLGAESKSGLPPGGEWRCLALAQVRNVGIRSDLWCTAVSTAGRSRARRSSIWP